MEGIKKLIRATAFTDVNASVRTEAQADLNRIKELVDNLCFEDQRMSSSGQEIYAELRKELGL